MAVYYVSTMPGDDGDHVVHTDSCPLLVFTPFRVNLGEYATCDDALQKARILYADVTGCDQCSGPCTSNKRLN